MPLNSTTLPQENLSSMITAPIPVICGRPSPAVGTITSASMPFTISPVLDYTAHTMFLPFAFKAHSLQVVLIEARYWLEPAVGEVVLTQYLLSSFWNLQWILLKPADLKLFQ